MDIFAFEDGVESIVMAPSVAAPKWRPPVPNLHLQMDLSSDDSGYGHGVESIIRRPQVEIRRPEPIARRAAATNLGSADAARTPPAAEGPSLARFERRDTEPVTAAVPGDDELDREIEAYLASIARERAGPGQPSRGRLVYPIAA